MKFLILLLSCWGTLPMVLSQSTEGTSFVVALPRTEHVLDGWIRMTARVETSFTIESATGTEVGTIVAGGTYTVSYNMAQRVTHGVENLGLIITADNSISVYIDTPTWMVDVAIARPIDPGDIDFFVMNYLGDETSSAYWPLSFYYVAASEDNTIVELFNDERKLITTVTLNKFDVYSQDASELSGGGDIDYTGVYVTADKPVSVFAGHGKVLFVDNNNDQYIFDSMPNTAELGISYTTFPIVFGQENTGYVLRALAISDGTDVTIPTLGISTTINAGEYYQEQHRGSLDSFKVECSLPCYVAELPIATLNNGGMYDTTMGGAMVPLTSDADFTTRDLLVPMPYLEDPSNNYVTLAIIADTFPVTEVYVNDENVNDIAQWLDGGGYAYASVLLESSISMVHITSLAGEQIAAYLYNNVHNVPAGTKAFSAGVP